jgi:membrane-associated phospholipid phosphatase
MIRVIFAKWALIFTLLALSGDVPAQGDSAIRVRQSQPHVADVIVPLTLTAYGFAALTWQPLKTFDRTVREEIWFDHPHAPIHLDNYLQYTPAVAVYALNAVGVKGLHDFWDRTIIYATGNALMGITVLSLKRAIKAPRPDGSGNDGFPSGHAGTVFAAAEFMRQEFRSRSPWYGIAAYTTAAATGYLRVYNDKHWFSELLTGAGIGILAAKASYWLFPVIERAFLPHRQKKSVDIL